MTTVHEPTMTFSIHEEREREMRQTLMVIYDALREKGYNPISQLVGYVMSGDPTYITNHNNARALVTRVERDEIVEELFRYYIDTLLKQDEERES